MIANKERTGAFTSSMVYVLMAKGNGKHGFSEKALTYIEERRIERRLGRSVGTDRPSKDMLWGLCMEQRVYELIGGKDFSGYEYDSKNSITHHKYDFWSGSPDLKSDTNAADIKCFKPKNFALLSDDLLSEDIARLKKNHPKEYWQVISNSCIMDVPKCEIIAYMPHEKELPAIKGMLDYMEGEDQWKYKFISDDIEFNRAALSYLPDDGYYKSLNRFEFEAPESDRIALTERIIQANRIITDDEPSVIIAHHDKEVGATIVEQEFNPSLLKKIS